MKKIFDNKKNKIIAKNLTEKYSKCNCTKIKKNTNVSNNRNKSESKKNAKLTFATTANNFYSKRFNLTSLLNDEVKPIKIGKLYSAKPIKDKKSQKNDSDYFSMEDIINNKKTFQESKNKMKIESILENDNNYISNYINYSKKKLSSEELSKETSFHNKKNKTRIRQSMTPFLKLKKIALFKNNLKLQKIKDIKRMQENLLILNNNNKKCLIEQNGKKIMNKPLKNYLLYKKLHKIDSKDNKILVKKRKKIELSLLEKALLVESENCSKLKYRDTSTQKNNNNDNFFIQKYSLTEVNIKNLYLKNQLTGIAISNFCKGSKSNL